MRLDGGEQFGRGGVVRLDGMRQAGAGLQVHVGAGRMGLEQAQELGAAQRRRRRHHADTPAALRRQRDRRLQSRLDADDRQRGMNLAQAGRGHRRRGIAGDDQRVDAFADQPARRCGASVRRRSRRCARRTAHGPSRRDRSARHAAAGGAARAAPTGRRRPSRTRRDAGAAAASPSSAAIRSSWWHRSAWRASLGRRSHRSRRRLLRCRHRRHRRRDEKRVDGTPGRD